MPLTDDNIDTHDEQLTGTFWDTFNVQDSGEITDVYGNSWVIFHEEDFNKFIYHYESLISSPIGRILHNSAADCLELMMSPLRETRTKFFAKKRLHKSIKEVWELCGWGVNDYLLQLLQVFTYPQSNYWKIGDLKLNGHKNRIK